MSTIHTITGKGLFEQYEALAYGTPSPGHLVQLLSTGRVGVHTTASGFAEKAFLIESSLDGHTISDAFAAGDRVQYRVFVPGALVNARIANGETIDIGDKLVSNADGTLKKITGDSSAAVDEPCVIGIAWEACDMSDSSAADPDGFCLIRIV